MSFEGVIWAMMSSMIGSEIRRCRSLNLSSSLLRSSVSLSKSQCMYSPRVSEANVPV